MTNSVIKALEAECVALRWQLRQRERENENLRHTLRLAEEQRDQLIRRLQQLPLEDAADYIAWTYECSKNCPLFEPCTTDLDKPMPYCYAIGEGLREFAAEMEEQL